MACPTTYVTRRVVRWQVCLLAPSDAWAGTFDRMPTGQTLANEVKRGSTRLATNQIRTPTTIKNVNKLIASPISLTGSIRDRTAGWQIIVWDGERAAIRSTGVEPPLGT